MKFELIDQVLERSADRVVAIKTLSAAEEYLADHFPTYPVMPGVLMIEAMVQAARAMLADRPGGSRLVLGEVRALRYGSFVRPGECLRVEVTLTGVEGDTYKCKGVGTVVRPGRAATEGRVGGGASGEGDGAGGGLGGAESGGGSDTAVSGLFSLRPIVGRASRAASANAEGAERITAASAATTATAATLRPMISKHQDRPGSLTTR